MTPARPALADVLGALTDREPYLRRALDDGMTGPPAAVVIEAKRVGYRWTALAGVTEGSTTWHAFTITSPAEALEVLHTRGLWPWEPGDESAPRWWCKCNGADGVWRGGVVSICGMIRGGQRGCGGEHWSEPPDLAALVAVASLGVTTLATVAALAGEVQPGAAVVFRVLTREALTKAHGVAASAAWGYVASAVREAAHVARGTLDASGASAALRALHACGVHLLACDPARVVLGVEALS